MSGQIVVMALMFIVGVPLFAWALDRELLRQERERKWAALAMSGPFVEIRLNLERFQREIQETVLPKMAELAAALNAAFAPKTRTATDDETPAGGMGEDR